jgi:hypothetical protein
LIGSLLTENIWVAVGVWTVVYVSDYYLSIWQARLYRDGADRHVVFRGSLEITPHFQQDINALRPLSLKFIRALVFSVVAISVVWVLAVRWAEIPQAFSILMGALLLLEATAHIRHVRNLAFMRSLKKTPGLTGKIEYPRWLSLRLSSVEIMGFAALFFLVFLGTGSWFFVGGSLSCLLTGLKHLDWASKADHETMHTSEEASIDGA